MTKNNGTAPDWGAVHRVRLGQINRLLRERYSSNGFIIPDDDAGDGDLFALLCVKAQCYRPDRREKALREAIALWTPWMPSDKAAGLVQRAMAERKIASDKLGKWLWIDADTRERLRLWQLGAYDKTPEEIRKWRRERERERSTQRRRERGCMTRSEYLQSVAENSKESTRPWEAMGISRRTYYYRQKRCTGSDRVPAKASPDTALKVVSAPLLAPSNHIPGIEIPLHSVQPSMESRHLAVEPSAISNSGHRPDRVHATPEGSHTPVLRPRLTGYAAKIGRLEARNSELEARLEEAFRMLMAMSAAGLPSTHFGASA